MSTDTISRNATRLWKLMNDGTTWCYKKIRETTHLSDREINAALGWLAREDTLEIIVNPVSKEETYIVRNFWDMAGISHNT